MRPNRLEVVADLTAQSSLTEGFLRLRRLRVRHHYSDGSQSPEYACDVVSRKGVDAVAAVLWHRDATGSVHVVLKEGVRPPIWLRREADLIDPDPEAPLVLVELVAGMLEAGDKGPGGHARRAAAEAHEEAAVRVAPGAFEPLGAASFPSPGITDERVVFVAAELNALPAAGASAGDGSGMEHGTRAVVMPLAAALAACHDGRIADMKTEIGLQRLAARLALKATPQGAAH